MEGHNNNNNALGFFAIVVGVPQMEGHNNLNKISSNFIKLWESLKWRGITTPQLQQR